MERKVKVSVQIVRCVENIYASYVQGSKRYKLGNAQSLLNYAPGANRGTRTFYNSGLHGPEVFHSTQ